VEAVAETIASGWIGMGARVAEFERAFAELCGVRHAVAVSSCTAAMHLALVAAGIGPGDTVITTPYTFTATAEAVLHAGASVRFADVDARTLNISPESVERAVDERVRAILPVHVAGLPCDMPALMALAESRGLFLLDDAAHAILAELEGRAAGTWAHASAFSFYPNKNLTTGEGGMVTTDDPALAERLRRIRYHAMDSDTWSRQRTTQPWRYDVVETGFKCNMTDIQAAIGLAQIAKLPEGRRIRERIATRYREAFASLDPLVLPAEPGNGRHAWHLYIMQLETERMDIGRDEFVHALNERNIGASVHYVPLHLMTHYRKVCGVRPGDFPEAERAYSRVVSLPLWPGMSEEDTEDVVAVVTALVRRHARRSQG
jgi:dTDP-4-amino-4,6-dideoxygalactose transaminase